VPRTPPTSADEGVANEATKLLKEWGRPDLTVSPTQVKGWRERDALPPTSAPGQGRGRGRKATYPAGTGRIAAALALALDDAKTQRELIFERALLIAFARGAEIPDAALRVAFRHVFERFIQKARRARSRQSRRERFRLPGPSDDVAARTALELLTHDSEDHAASAPPRQLVEHTAEAIADREAVDFQELTEQRTSTSTLGGLLVRLNLAAMERTALRARRADLDWALSCARAFADFSAAWVRTMPLAREDVDEYRLVRQVLAAAARLFSNDLMVALASPAFLLASPTPTIRRRLDQCASAARAEAPRLIARARAHLRASPSGDSFFSFLIVPESNTLTR
jgi:hypothetical protein